MGNKKLLIENETDLDIFVRQMLNIGEAMYQTGSEISRIEDRLHQLADAYGASHVNVYAKPSIIILTVEFGANKAVTQQRRITLRSSVDCQKMEELDRLCRECAVEPLPLPKLREKVRSIIDKTPDTKKIFIGQVFAAAAFAVFFGGGFWDFVAAGFGALIISALQKWIRPYFNSELFFNIASTLVTGICMNLLNLWIPGLHISQILIGDIMIVIPGANMTNSIRYILSGDIMSSFEKLIDSILQACGIALGFLLSMMIVPQNVIAAPVFDPVMTVVIQIIAAGAGTLGFCMMCNTQWKYIVIPVLGGFASWSVYLLGCHFGISIFASTLIAAFVVGTYCEFFSNTLRVANTMLFIPACIPLVPGGSLYYCVQALLEYNMPEFWAKFQSLVLTAVGIAMGLAMVIEIERIYMRVKKKRLEQGK